MHAPDAGLLSCMNDAMQVFSELHAESFLRAFEHCMSPSVLGLGTPALVCAALSAELGLKALLARRGIAAAKGHNLRKLLNLLPPDDQAAIVVQTSKSFPAFEVELAKAAKSFVEWRYIYESKDAKYVNVRFVGDFAAAIHQRITEVRKCNLTTA